MSNDSAAGAARLIGRVGGLAAALGVGVGILVAGQGVACADSARPDSAAADSARPAAGPRAAAREPARGSRSAVAQAPRRSAAAPRQPVATARATTAATTTTAAATAASPITVDPQISWGGQYRTTDYPGLLVGAINATSDLPLTYTTVEAPDNGGKLAYTSAPSKTLFSRAGEFFYLPDAATLTDATATESFQILVAQRTAFDEFLTSLPVIGLLAPSLLLALHRAPILSDLLAPLIGASQVVTFTVNPYDLATDPVDPTRQRPTAFTAKVESFDGLLLSTNYFPAANVAEGLVDAAPTVLSGPGLGSPGTTDPVNPYGQLILFPFLDDPVPRPDQFGSLTPGLPVLRTDSWESPDGGPSYDGGGGYNVITWDPRGEWASRDPRLPGLQIDNPFFEGRDASAIISWAYGEDNPARTQVEMEAPGDPYIGMVGGSYGGGIQWVTASTDPRVDSISPEISWNSLISALYPNTNQFKTGWGTVLLLALVTTGADINRQIYAGIGSGVTLGVLSQTAQAVLSSSGPTVLLDQVKVPTLIVQGIQDGLFPLAESVANAEALLNNPWGTEVKMVWFCGGHGTCLDPLNPYQDDRGLIDNLKWLDQYVAGSGTPASDLPRFQFYDQLGGYWTSELLPFEDGFNLPEPLTATSAGGRLGIVPVIGGSGPGVVDGVSVVLTLGNGTPARNALNLTITPDTGAQVVGSPTLSFDYRGLGTSRTVYAQLIDDASGLVLGNIVTPIPVTLDGQQRSITIPMADIVYTAATAGASLTLQITSSATNFENFTSYGLIDISDIQIDLPIRAV